MRKTQLIAAAALWALGISCAALPLAAQQPAAAPAAAIDAAGLDQLLPDVIKYELGQSRKPLEQVQEIVVKSVPDAQKRGEVAKKLAAVLASSAATFECKDFICRQLYIIGTSAEVPPIARLLPDEKLSHMARYVLEAMGDAAADAAMHDALGGLKGKLLIGAINSLGDRRDLQAVAKFKELLPDADPAVATAAIAALGKIGGPDAARALAALARDATLPDMKANAADAYLMCADGYSKEGKKAEAAAIYEEMRTGQQPPRIRMAALRGLAVAAPEKAMPLVIDLFKSSERSTQAMGGALARQLVGNDATKAFAAALPSLPASGQMFLLDALAYREDAGAKPAVLNAAKSDDAQVRAAAARALAALGDDTDIPLLIEFAARDSGPERDAAREALAHIRGVKADAAIIAALATAKPPLKVELIGRLAYRQSAASVPELLRIAEKDADPATRAEAAIAVVKISKGSKRADTKAALQKVINSPVSESVRKRAQDAMDALKQ